MKLLFSFATIAILLGATHGCKCGSNFDATRACCKSAGGSVSGNDCPASGISERLSNFASCCNNLGSRSDCRCPRGCRAEIDAERIAQGLSPLTDEEAVDLDTEPADLDDGLGGSGDAKIPTYKAIRY